MNPTIRVLELPTAFRTPAFGPAVEDIKRVRVTAERGPVARTIAPRVSWPQAIARALGMASMAALIAVSASTAFAAEHCPPHRVHRTTHVMRFVPNSRLEEQMLRDEAYRTYNLLVENRQLRAELHHEHLVLRSRNAACERDQP